MSPLKKIMIAAAAVAMTTVIVGCGSDEKVDMSSAQEKEVAERLAPAGEVAMEDEVAAVAPAAPASAEPRSGEEVYNSKCFTCHGTGAAGAPKMGVAADWTARIEQGMDTLYSNAINGIRAMPPKGLCMDCSDDEIKAAVDYILEGSK